MSVSNFEAAGNNHDWPANEPGKATQAAVFGVKISVKPRTYELLWTGQFPDLQPAMYWAAKKELAAIRSGNFEIASRVLWQHDLSPEQAVQIMFNDMQQQIDRIADQYEGGADIDLGKGLMQPVDHSKAAAHLVEIPDPTDNSRTLFSEFIPNDPDFDPANPLANLLNPKKPRNDSRE